MRTSAFRVGTPNGRILLFASKLAAFLFFRLPSIRDSVAALRRVVSVWSAIRTFRPGSPKLLAWSAAYPPLEGVEMNIGGVPWRSAPSASI